MSWTHKSAGLSVAGFTWLFAVLFVIVTGTPMRALLASLLLAAAGMIVTRLRNHRRRRGVPWRLWHPAARGNG